MGWRLRESRVTDYRRRTSTYRPSSWCTLFGARVVTARRQWIDMAQDKEQVDGALVAQHNTRDKGVWIVVHGNVYDVTDFLDDHPGGAAIIMQYAGKDATEEYEPIHPPDAIRDNLDPSKHLGPLKPSTLPAAEGAQDDQVALEKSEAKAEGDDDGEFKLPPLEEVLSLHDFESLARRTMARRGWNYYSSGADDEITMRENHTAFHRLWFRPRVLRNVKTVDYSTEILGQKTSMPIYITATALGKLGHKDGELCLTRAAAKHDVIQMIPTLASCSFDELVDAAIDGQTQFLQLYVNADRERTKKIVEHAERRGIKGLFITVDAPQLGRREKDMRTKFTGNASSYQTSGKDDFQRDQGAARAISSFIDPSLNWSDLAWFKQITKMPIILKGVQCWEDAVMAAEAGMSGVVLSNHGGRQLDFAPSGIEVLPSVVSALTSRGFFPSKGFQIFVDGGVRRATDVLKAIALGATAVGIGRPMLYAMSTYGEDGVSRALQILKDEFEMNLRLLGAPTIKDVVPNMVDASALHMHATSVPQGSMYDANYEKLAPNGTVKARL